MSEPVTPEVPTAEKVPAAEEFFNSVVDDSDVKPSIETPSGTPTDGIGPDGKKVDPPAAVDPNAPKVEDQPPVDPNKPADNKLFGKYNDVEDALKNHDNAMGGFATHKQLEEVTQTLKGVADTMATLNEKKPSGHREINPETQQPYTQEERVAAWNEKFAENPAAAMAQLVKVTREQGSKDQQKIMAETVAQVKRDLIWENFKASNQEMGTKENVAKMEEVFAAYPILLSRSDALINAKAIILSPGNDLMGKYAAWVQSTTNGNGNGTGDPPPPKDPPPQILGQGPINKGGAPVKEDSFSFFEPAFYA